VKALEDAHEDGAHVRRMHPDCARCAWAKPGVDRMREDVAYILTGSTKWPPRFDLDEDLLLDERFWDPGEDPEGPFGVGDAW